MAATLQHLSGGRFVLGIGAGWRAEEYAAYGYDFPKPSVRFAQLEEAVTICRLMWTQDSPSFEGRYFRIDGRGRAAAARPAAAHLHRGGGREDRAADGGPARRHVERPAERGEDWTRRLDIVRRAAEEAGRDPAAIEVSVTLERALPETDDDSARLVEELSARHDAGADHFVMDFGNPALDRARAALRRAGDRAAAGGLDRQLRPG